MVWGGGCDEGAELPLSHTVAIAAPETITQTIPLCEREHTPRHATALAWVSYSRAQMAELRTTTSQKYEAVPRRARI